MALRPPRGLPGLRPALDNPLAGLEHELLQQSAEVLGALGRELNAALDALAAFEAAHPRPLTEERARTTREALLARAGDVLWRFVIQREACGLRDSERLMQDYKVPAAVRLRMGVFPRRARA